MNGGRISFAGWVALGVGLIWGMTLPMGASAVSYWTELDASDFNCGTYSSTHLKDVSGGLAYIHLEDNNSETHSVQNNPTTYKPLPIDPGSGSNIWVDTYSQSFQPTFTGVVDQIDLQIYKVGNPKDSNDDDARLIIELHTANQNAPRNPTGTALIWMSYPASSISANPGTWTTFYLTETDSYDNTVLVANTHYAILVTSNAVANSSAEFRWQYADVADSNTDADEKGYDSSGFVCWRQMVSNGTIADFQHRIYVHDFVHSGDFVSQVHDFGQNVNFVSVAIVYQAVTGGSVTLYTRCGPTATPDGSWCNWIDQGTGSENPGMDPARYAQYKLEFVAGTDDDLTYSVNNIEIGYI